MRTQSFTIQQFLSDNWGNFLYLSYNPRPAIPKNVEKVIHCGASCVSERTKNISFKLIACEASPSCFYHIGNTF